MVLALTLRYGCVTVDVASPWSDEIVYLTRCEYCAHLSSIAFAALHLNALSIVFLIKLLFTPKVGMEVCFRSITQLLSLDRFSLHDFLPAIYGAPFVKKLFSTNL